ncbi:hypothetical protein CEXT_621631 [Caerostris extrusa]|uniref:Uncharacterized protein n=1 Tax=Caerostris extrusa TaxID=172846 RepID=A0AAV4XD03_CAEEX|nr:hypothetical protein CEXT_621631 [Caerostris extrusa]
MSGNINFPCHIKCVERDKSGIFLAIIAEAVMDTSDPEGIHIIQEYVIKQRDEEKIQDDVMEVNETAESDNCDEMEETDPATPSTEERMDDSDDDCKSSKNATFEQKPSSPKPNNVVSDVIEIGSSSDVSTEPGCELLESRKREARREERSNLLTEQPVFISDEIEVIEVKNSEHDSSDSLPSLKEFIVI